MDHDGSTDSAAVLRWFPRQSRAENREEHCRRKALGPSTPLQWLAVSPSDCTERERKCDTREVGTCIVDMRNNEDGKQLGRRYTLKQIFAYDNIIAGYITY